MVAYNTIDEQAGRSEIDIWLRAEHYCGRGYGRAAIGLLSAHLGERFGLAEVWAQPSERNPRSLRAFQKAGFERRASASDAVFGEYGPPDHLVVQTWLPGKPLPTPPTSDDVWGCLLDHICRLRSPKADPSTPASSLQLDSRARRAVPTPCFRLLRPGI